MVANILGTDTPSTWGGGGGGAMGEGGMGESKHKLFSGYGHVAYQIKGRNTFSNMVANILLTDTPYQSDLMQIWLLD